MSRESDELEAADARRSAEYELRVTMVDHLERIADALEAHVDLVQTQQANKRSQIHAIDTAIVTLLDGILEHDAVPKDLRPTIGNIRNVFGARLDRHKDGAA
jgi:hypothetical protein